MLGEKIRVLSKIFGDLSGRNPVSIA